VSVRDGVATSLLTAGLAGLGTLATQHPTATVEHADLGLTALCTFSCAGVAAGALLFYAEWRDGAVRAGVLRELLRMQGEGDQLLDEIALGGTDFASLNARAKAWELDVCAYLDEHLPYHAITFRTLPLSHIGPNVHEEVKRSATMLLFRLDALKQILLTVG